MTEVEELEGELRELERTEAPSSVALTPLQIRHRWVGVIAMVVAVGLIAFLLGRAAPGTTVNAFQVANQDDLSVGPTVAGAAYFPFQPTPQPAVSGSVDSGVINATIAGSVVVVGCASGPSCPGVSVELLTYEQLHQLTATGASGYIWCAGGATGCSISPSTTFSVDVTGYSGTFLNLVVVSAPGETANVTVTATLYWAD